MRESYYVIVVSRERFILRSINKDFIFDIITWKCQSLYLIIIIFFFLISLTELNISTETIVRNYNFIEICKTNNRKKRTVCRLLELRAVVCE